MDVDVEVDFVVVVEVVVGCCKTCSVVAIAENRSRSNNRGMTVAMAVSVARA